MNTTNINKNMTKIRGETLTREISFTVNDVNQDDRTIEVAFSSETPIERWFGIEILSHEPSAVNLGRLLDGAPVLVNHNNNDHVGVIKSAGVGSDRKARATLRFGRSGRAEEVYQDVLDGIRPHVSVGYQIDEFNVIRGEGDAPDTYIATKWTPHEISLASVPADISVGVGRTLDVEPEPINDNKEIVMTIEVDNSAPVVDVDSIRAETRKAEIARVKEIQALGTRFMKTAEAADFIQRDKSVEEFRSFILESMPEVKPVNTTPEIGMSKKEINEFSFLRAVRALTNPNERKFQDQAKFERECSDTAAQRYGVEPRGIMVPYDVLAQRRDLTVTQGSPVGPGGGFLVGTDHLGASFIELLRNASVTMRAGVRTLSGLVGNVTIPKQTGGATHYWVAENVDITESAASFGQAAMSPKTLGARTEMSRQLMMQSDPSVEGLVREDLATTVALAIDSAVLYGTAANGQPRGIKNVSGIGSVVFGAGSPTDNLPTFAQVVALETAVEVDNALLGTLAYVTNATNRGHLKTTKKDAGSGEFVWTGGIDGTLNGYTAYSSNQVTTNDCFYGNWADVIVGQWGGLDIIVDPYTGSASGAVRIVLLQSVDVLVRHAESFALGS